ncbi:hypothetical protein DPMN_016956 [Dreissena polymorpha]|uniref:Uncharacterized protein n=2 Tax=Dreissena polymorpha TaxID=45954 RepID=A0A9D4NEA9_DREPO|nr:hypothetical protein DPMN_016956 [Dreissena polymorpha]
MREGPEGDGSVTTDKSVGSEDEGTNHSANMSIDRSKDESDLSDYGEENTTCQLANQAVRARLLSSVVNSATVNDSKLRVSVFDHRSIPRKFIIPKTLESRPSVSCLDKISSDDMNKRPQNLNGLNVKDGENGIRKGSTSSYTVLKANRRFNGDSGSTSSKSSPTSPLDSENDVRTSFDVLLRNLIGDVNDLNVQSNATPVAFSSGYESDYPQNKDLQFSKNKSGSNNNLKSEHNKTDCVNVDVANNARIGYYSEQSNGVANAKPLQGSHSFSSLPSFPISQSEPSTGSLKRHDSKEVPLVTLASKDVETDQQGFSYAQRHNYKLTKVTRSMYEIINDLQNGEKGALEVRKRARKGRRSSQEINNYVESGNTSFKENKPRGRLETENGLTGNKAEPLGTMKICDSTPAAFSGAVVRCVRRPLGNDLPLPQRNFSLSENSNKLTGSLANKCGNKVQNDLRNLLCDTSTATLSSGGNNDQWRDLNNTTGGHNTLLESSSAADSTFNQTGFSVANESNAGNRRPTLNQQFNNRIKADDHVYETIPGDEKLYEQWKRERENPKIPKIRRFTTIPDLPGTFIPKEPPALPERNYLHNSIQPLTKDRDSYICMGDVNSNFANKENLNISKPSASFMNLPTDTILFESSFFQCYPLPDDISPQRNTGRTDETSDGYCSIDNLSLLREHIHEKSHPETPPRERISSENQNFFRPRIDLFLSPMAADELNDSGTFREKFRNEIPRLLSRQLSRDEDLGLTFRAPVNFESYREQTKPVFQATYV